MTRDVIIDGLMQSIFRIKGLLDTVVTLVSVATMLALGLVLSLSIRLRQRELQTIYRLGCSRQTSFRLIAAELFLVCLGAGVLAALALMVLGWNAEALVGRLLLS